MSNYKPAKADNRRAELRRQQEAAARAAQRKKIVIGVVAGLCALVLVVGVVALVRNFQQAEAANRPPNANSDGSGIIVNPGKAKEGAPVVALFQDYQCPACKQFEDAYGASLTELADNGDIQLEYHTMTFLDTNLRNDASKRAGIAAACADTVGHYGDYHDTVYKNQPSSEGEGYTDEQLTGEFAQQAGITGQALTDFQACFQTRKMESWVNKTDQAAGKAGVTGTPALQVNGKTVEIQSLGDPSQLKSAIDKAAA